MTMREEIEAAAARYPDRRSAIMPALMIAQKEHGHLPGPVLEEVAQILGVERVWVYELATFYTLFHTEPIGRFHLQLCDNVSCMLCGSEALLTHLETTLGSGRARPRRTVRSRFRPSNVSGPAKWLRLCRSATITTATLMPRGSMRCWRASARRSG